MTKRVLWLGLALLTVAAAPVDPDAPSIRVLVKKDDQVSLDPKVKVGEPFHVVVTATSRPDVVVNLAATLDVQPFEVVERKEGAGAPGSGERSYDLTVVAWKPGKQTLPPIPITYVAHEKGDLRTISTEPLDVEVIPVIAEAEAKVDLRPTVGPVSVLERDWRLVYAAIAVGGAALVFAAVALLVRWRRRRRVTTIAAQAIVDARPAHEVALERLRVLATSPLLNVADRKPFYFALTDVVRDYLGKRYGFDALEQTTSELNEHLERAPEAKDVRGDIALWLGDCDLVKFARVPANREDALGAHAQAVALVENCTPRPAPVVRPEEVAS